MKIEKGWFYLSVARDHFHIEFDIHPKLWLVFSLNTHLDKEL